MSLAGAHVKRNQKLGTVTKFLQIVSYTVGW